MKFTKLIQWHINKYKIRQIRDIYKLLYQGTLGNSHYVTVDDDELKTRLIDEIDSIVDDFRQPLMECIATDNKFVRINLRPFKWYEYSPQKLLFVMKESAIIPTDKDNFFAAWKKFGSLLNTEDKTIFMKADDYEKFDREMAQENYPAVHHSQDYARKNKPAYRVVCRDIFLKNFSVDKTV